MSSANSQMIGEELDDVDTEIIKPHTGSLRSMEFDPEEEKIAAICSKMKSRLENPTSNPPSWTKDPDFKADMTSMVDGVVDNGLANKQPRWISLSEAKKNGGCVGTECIYAFNSGMSLWGTTGKPEFDDVGQGELGDCYYLATISTIAEHNGRIQKLFEATTYAAGAAVDFWVGGVKTRYVVDDIMPFKKYYTQSGKEYCGNYFAKVRSRGATWPLFLEKAFAKAAGTYGIIAGGNFGPALRLLTGVPYDSWDLKTLTAAELYAKVQSGEQNKFLMACSTGSGSNANTNSLGLVMGHQYTVFGTCKLDNGQKLIITRNPWGSEKYSGPYSDGDAYWSTATADEKSRCKFRSGANDGLFRIPPDSFIQGFSGLSIGYYLDSHETLSEKWAPDPNAGSSCHQVQISSAQAEMWFSVDSVSNYLMGTYCNNNMYNRLSLTVTRSDGSTVCEGRQKWSNNNFAHCSSKNLAAGTYTVRASVTLGSGYVNYATVNSYAANGKAWWNVCGQAPKPKPAVTPTPTPTNPTPTPQPAPTPPPAPPPPPSLLTVLLKDATLYNWAAVEYTIRRLGSGEWGFYFKNVKQGYTVTMTATLYSQPMQQGNYADCTHITSSNTYKCVSRLTFGQHCFWFASSGSYGLRQSYSW